MPENAAGDGPRPETTEKDTVLTTAKSGWIWVVLVGAVGVLAAWDCMRRGYWGMGLSVIVWIAAVCWLLALIFVTPKLSIGSEGVTCRNVMVQVFIPWRRLGDVKQTLFIELVPRSGEAVKVWSAPVSSMQRVRQRSRDAAARSQAGTYNESQPKTPELPRAILEERDRRLEGTNGRGMNGEVEKSYLKRDWSICGVLFVLALVSLLLV
ncbi:MAG: hypothetical protein ACTIJJ_10250 [Galactobacter sp.]